MTPKQYEIHHCASIIFGDLSRHCRRVSFDALCNLCERYHHPPLFDLALESRRGGKSCNGEIILSPHCTHEQYLSVIPHELVHALAETPRWEHLNYEIEGWKHNRTEFLEAVASLVGKLFFYLHDCQ